MSEGLRSLFERVVEIEGIVEIERVYCISIYLIKKREKAGKISMLGGKIFQAAR